MTTIPARRLHAILTGAISLASLSTVPAQAQSVEEFYKGKNINLVIGFEAGGGYDIYGAAAGAASRPVTSPVSRTSSCRTCRAPAASGPRNTSIRRRRRTAPPSAPSAARWAITPLLTPGAQFDGTKFTWLGSITNEVSTCVSWHTSPVKTWNDVLTKSITFGGDGPGADPDVFALLYKNVFDAKIKLVSGYHGTTPIILAMERGEVDGLCGYSWSTIKSKNQAWLDEKKINILVQAALKKEPDLPDVPLALDLAKTEEQRQILKSSSPARKRRARSRRRPASPPTARPR